MFSFGSGVLFGRRTDVANATPINFGLIQSATIDETASIKELFGQFQRPVAIARGSIKTTGKAVMARISPIAIGTLFYGVTPQAGQTATAFAEAAVAATSTASANAATWLSDWGVIYANTGLPLSKVASAPTVGQYSVTSGTYTFATADVGQAVLLNYDYMLASAGVSIPVTNLLLGTTPTFSARFYTSFQSLPLSVTYNNLTSSKFSFASKLEDFVMPEIDFSAFADASGKVCTWSFGEAS